MENGYQFNQKSVLIRNKFHLPNSKDWRFISGIDYSKYLDREDAKAFPNFSSYSNYFGERPGSLGLRDMFDKPIDLTKENAIPKIHKKSPVWEAVISFDENLSLLVEPTYLQKAVNMFLWKMIESKWYKFDVRKIHFEYAIHVNTKHTHVHLKWYYKDTYQHKLKNGKIIDKKVKGADVRTKGQITQNFINAVKLEITKNLVSYLKYQKKDLNPKIDYQEKIQLIKLYKAKFQDELINQSLTEDIMKLIKSFKHMIPKDFRYAYLKPEQKEIIDAIHHKFILKNIYFKELEDTFLNKVQKHYEDVVDLSNFDFVKFKDIVKDKVKFEHNELEKELKNSVLKAIKDIKDNDNNKTNEFTDKEVEIKDNIVKYILNPKNNLQFRLENKDAKPYEFKKYFNKFLIGLGKEIPSNHNLEKAIRNELTQLEKLLIEAEKAKGLE